MRIYRSEGGHWKPYNNVCQCNKEMYQSPKQKIKKENLRQMSKKADERQRGFLMFWFNSEENYSIQN